MVTNQGNTYLALANSTGASLTDTTKWQLLIDTSDIQDATSCIADTYSSSSTYEVGDYVLHSGSLYQCNTPITTAEAWTAAHWTQTNFADCMGGEITDLKSAIKQESEASGNDFLEFLPGFIDFKGTSTATDTENRTPSVSGICSAVVTCSPGDQFTCTLYGAGSSNGGARAYAFLNSEKKGISGNYAASNTTLTNQTITAPSGAAYCVFNSKPDNRDYYVIAGDTIGQKHVALEKKVELINKISTQSTALEWESGSLASSDGSNASNAARIRTVTSGINVGIRSITANDGYTFCVYGWNGNSYIGIWTGSAFDSTVSSNANYFQSALDILPCFAVATKIRLVVKRKDGASMTVDEGVNILYLYDETLHAVKEVADEAKETVEKFLFNACVESMWENGTLSNGSNSANDTRLRTKTYLPEGVRKIIATNGYEFVACAYNKQTGAYEGIIKANGTIGQSTFVWHTSVDIADFTAYKFRLVLRNSNDTSSDMDVSESANCLLMSYTDGTLSFSGAPADALTVGERLNDIETGMRYGHFSVKRNNPTYVTQMLNLAQGYMAANADPILRNSKHFQYGNNSILSVSTSTNLIDCSTFVGLVMRGYGLSETSYMADVPLRNPAEWVAKSGIPWAIDPFDWKNISKPGESPSRLRWAAQLAQWMEERGQVVPMDSGLADVMPGDILFWAKKTSDGSAWVEPKRYKHISHVGFCLSRTKTPDDDPDVDASVYPYKHMTIEVGHETYDEDETTVLQGCVKSKLVEYEPADSAEWETTNNIHTLVLVCRPDLGSI